MEDSPNAKSSAPKGTSIIQAMKVHPARSFDEWEKEALVHEISLLKEKLRVAHATVSNARAALLLEKQRTRRCVAAWRQRVDEGTEQLRRQKLQHEATSLRQRLQHDQQMERIAGSLALFEEQLRQEQSNIVATLEEKETKIATQRRRIQALAAANQRLMKGKTHCCLDDRGAISEDDLSSTPRCKGVGAEDEVLGFKPASPTPKPSPHSKPARSSHRRLLQTLLNLPSDGEESTNGVDAKERKKSAPRMSGAAKEKVSGGANRLVRRASSSLRNWWSFSDRSEDDEDSGGGGWHSDFDLASSRRHAVHPHLRQAPAFTAKTTAAPATKTTAAPASAAKTTAAAAKTPSRRSSLSRTFKALLSPQPKSATSKGEKNYGSRSSENIFSGSG